MQQKLLHLSTYFVQHACCRATHQVTPTVHVGAPVWCEVGCGCEGSAVTLLAQDHVHGLIRLDAVCMHVIDTPHYQRLRDLKQLGLS